MNRFLTCNQYINISSCNLQSWQKSLTTLQRNHCLPEEDSLSKTYWRVETSASLIKCVNYLVLKSNVNSLNYKKKKKGKKWTPCHCRVKLHITPLVNFPTIPLKGREFDSNRKFWQSILAQKAVIIYHKHYTIIS